MTLTSHALRETAGGADEDSAAPDQICQHAATLVLPGMRVGIAGGYLAPRLARQLRSITDVTIVTNSLDVAAVLSDFSPHNPHNRTVIVLSGQLSHERTTVGSMCVEALHDFDLDLAFLSAQGFDPEHASFSASAVSADVERAFARSSRRVAALADSAHWRQRLPQSLPGLRADDIVITDAFLQETDRAAATRAGVRLALAGFVRD
jgi:DeoR/GlpR family transcriptional regulator of sugar metabolism